VRHKQNSRKAIIGIILLALLVPRFAHARLRAISISSEREKRIIGIAAAIADVENEFALFQASTLRSVPAVQSSRYKVRACVFLAERSPGCARVGALVNFADRDLRR